MAFKQIFVAPALQKLGIWHPKDPTWGRYLLPECAYEAQLERNVNSDNDEKAPGEMDDGVTVRRRRVFIDRNGQAQEGEDVSLTGVELKRSRGRKWVYYKVWEMPAARTAGKGRGCDIVVCHGMGEYGGKISATARSLLQHGFRVVAPDMPSHGRSTGVHVHLKTTDVLPNAVLAVLTDLGRWSPEPPVNTFLYGSSMGGFTAVNYVLKHNDKIPIDGVFLVCPLLGLAPESRKPKAVELFARMLSSFMGRLPLVPSVVDEATRDPEVIREWANDERQYHGKVRIATGLTLVTHLDALQSRAPEFTVPVQIIHGDSDRVTSHLHSQDFIDRVASFNKECTLYEGCEHVIFSIGSTDERNEAVKQRFLNERDDWFAIMATCSKEE